MPRLTVDRLPNERVGEAYPLIRAATRISPKRWAAYVRFVRRRKGDVVVVVDEENIIYGAAAFRPGSTLRHPHCLIVDALAAFEMTNIASVKGKLSEALQAEAVSRGCSSILVQTAAPKSTSERTSADQWRGLGFTPESITIVQEIGLVTPPGGTGSGEEIDRQDHR